MKNGERVLLWPVAQAVPSGKDTQFPANANSTGAKAADALESNPSISTPQAEHKDVDYQARKADIYLCDAERSAINQAFDKFVDALQHTEADGKVALYSHAEEVVPGSPLRPCVAFLTPLAANMPGITLKVAQSTTELPGNAVPSDVEGAHYSGNAVYLVADNLPTAQCV